MAIVGAGGVGLGTAYQLLNDDPSLSIAIFEKESEVAAHQTGHNSGVIHSGVYYKPGSLKARNCTEGYKKLLAFCDENNVPYDLCGKIIVATEDWEIPLLDAIYEKGVQNGLKKLAFLDNQEMREIEPHVDGIKAIHVPQAGIISYKKVAQKLQELLTQKGVQFFFQTKVEDFDYTQSEVTIKTKNQNYTAQQVINCGGLYSDKLAQATGFGEEIDYQIVPFRGEYYVLQPEATHLVKGLIYPVPDPSFPFLGVHFTKMISGGVEAGPNAVLAFRREGYKKRQIHLGELGESLAYSGFRKLASQYFGKGMYELYRSFSKTAFTNALKKLIPSIEQKHIRRGGAGVRAQALKANGEMVDDFLILQKNNIINVCNAPSPAATSCLEIGNTIAQKALNRV